MKLKNLYLLVTFFLTSFLSSCLVTPCPAQENPSPVEDGLVARCSITVSDTSTWKSVYIGSKDIRKNISIVVDSTNTASLTKIAFKNSSNIPDTTSGYYWFNGKIRQWKNRNSDYLYYKSNKAGAFWINIEYINGPSLDLGGVSIQDLQRLFNGSTTFNITVDTLRGDAVRGKSGTLTLLSNNGLSYLFLTNAFVTLAANSQLRFNVGGSQVGYFNADTLIIPNLQVTSKEVVNLSTIDSLTGNFGNFTILKKQDSLVATQNWIRNNFTPFDSSLYVLRSAFSQSITATGGLMQFENLQDDIMFISDVGSISFSSSGSILFEDVGGTEYLIRAFPSPSGSAVTPATMKTITLTLSDGTTQQFYVPN